MKKILLLLSILPLFTSFILNDNELATIGGTFKYNLVVYNNTEPLMIVCNFRGGISGQTVVTYRPKFTIYRKKSTDSIENKSTCFPVINDSKLIANRAYSQIGFQGRVEKAISDNGYVFFGTSHQIFILDISTMHFSSFIEKKKNINDFTVIENKLYIATNQGIEIIDIDENRKVSFNHKIVSIDATTGKKHIIISEVNDDENILKKRILRTKDLKEKIVLDNPTLLKNLIDITPDNHGLIFNSETKSLSLYNLKKELKLKEILIPVQDGEKISELNILNFDNDKVLAEITYSESRSYSEKILTGISLKTGTIEAIVDFESNCNEYVYGKTR